MRYTFAFLIFLFSIVTTQAQVDWGIGTKWIYNSIDYDSIFGKEVHKPVTYELIDTTVVRSQKCYILKLKGSSGEDYVRWDGNEVYIFHHEMDDFVKTYSFGNDSSFVSSQYDHFRGDRFDFTITIDSTYMESVEGKLLQVSEYLFEDSDSILYGGELFKVYDNIGFGFYSVLPPGIAPITIGTYAFDNIRCFENNGELINFQDYPCDAVLALNTSVNDAYTDVVRVSPNPSNGHIQIANAEGSSYSIYDNIGHIIQSGILEGNEIFIGQQGLHFIQINYRGSIITRQVMIQ